GSCFSPRRPAQGEPFVALEVLIPTAGSVRLRQLSAPQECVLALSLDQQMPLQETSALEAIDQKRRAKLRIIDGAERERAHHVLSEQPLTHLADGLGGQQD